MKKRSSRALNIFAALILCSALYLNFFHKENNDQLLVRKTNMSAGKPALASNGKVSKKGFFVSPGKH